MRLANHVISEAVVFLLAHPLIPAHLCASAFVGLVGAIVFDRLRSSRRH